jgi:hypothetical protein
MAAFLAARAASSRAACGLGLFLDCNLEIVLGTGVFSGARRSLLAL